MASAVLLQVEVHVETDKALLVLVDGEREKKWVPKSQVVWDESNVETKGDTGTLAVTEWIAEQKGWA